MRRGNQEKDLRPVLEIPRTYEDWFLDVISIIGLILMASCLIYYWPILPSTIPTHFNASGVPDSWGGKSTLLLLPVGALVMYVLFFVINFFPHIYNYPWPITEKNARAQYRLARSLLGWMKAEIIWLFLYITWVTVLVALGRQDGMGPAFIFVSLGVIFGTVGVYFFRAARAR
ncbi:MAG: DUF1648 domain-containing protein [Dehalobacterium sp.]|jgi:uncharacterized membrane protein